METWDPSRATRVLHSSCATVVVDRTGMVNTCNRLLPLMSPIFIPSKAYECSMEMRTGPMFLFWQRRMVPDRVLR